MRKGFKITTKYIMGVMLFVRLRNWTRLQHCNTDFTGNGGTAVGGLYAGWRKGGVHSGF